MDDEDGFRTTPPPPPPRQNPLLTFARDNLALLIPIVGALIFAFRCVIVSEGDLYVAYMLVSTTSIGDAIRALFFTVVPFLLLISSYVVAFEASIRILSGNWRNLSTLGLVVVSVALPVGWAYLIGVFQTFGVSYQSMLSIFLFATSPLAITFMATGFEWRERRSPTEPMEGTLGRMPIPISIMALIALWTLLILALGFAPKTFWLPRERLVFRNEDPFTGYVLKASEDYLVILHDEPRVIVEKEKDTLEDRDFCYPNDHKARSSNMKSDAPECP